MNDLSRTTDPAHDPGEDDDGQRDHYLVFVLESEDYGIEIRHVAEIVVMQKIVAIPDMPDFLKGIISLRGRAIPVVDLRTRFRLPFREYDEHTCVTVIDMNETLVGLIVDTVREVTQIPASSISPPPQLSREGAGRYLIGMGMVGEGVKILLDARKIFRDEELSLVG